ncbi:MAG: hypothetical protein JRJ87_06320 [Deltaproteobacteria bacterium]|nr:hypothetical protein [Deltaproteobacteria bacterium]
MRKLLLIALLVVWSNKAGAYYDYEALGQMFTIGHLVDVAWHPDGEYALTIESGGKILKILAADWSVSQLTELTNFRPDHMDFNPDGSGALIVGWYASGNTEEGRVYRYDHETGSVDLLADCSKPGISLRGVDFTPDAAKAVIIGYNSTAHIVYAYDYDPETRTVTTGAAANFSGPCDVSWRPDGLEALIPICENAADVVAYRPPAPWENRLLSTNPSASNVSAADHHPLEGYGVIVDWSDNALKWDGFVWTKAELPGGSSMAGIAFNADGSRALIVGRCYGSNLVGTVNEFVADNGTFLNADFREVSIPGFDAAPWGATNNTYLNAVAFRPGLCEGLIVGGHASYDNKFAPIAHFTDIRGADCLEIEQDGGIDAGVDAGSDAGVDAGSDAGIDAGSDPGSDPGVDAGTDAGTDAGVDAGGDQDGGGSTLIPCSDDVECPQGNYCDGDYCTSDCDDNSDCMAPFVCDQRGRCVPEEQDGSADGQADGISDAGADSAADEGIDAGSDPGSGNDHSACEYCAYDSQCPSGSYCRDACCVSDCFTDTECMHGFVCGNRGRCISEPVAETACACSSKPTTPRTLFLALLLVGVWIVLRRRSQVRPVKS